MPNPTDFPAPSAGFLHSPHTWSKLKIALLRNAEVSHFRGFSRPKLRIPVRVFVYPQPAVYPQYAEVSVVMYHVLLLCRLDNSVQITDGALCIVGQPDSRGGYVGIKNMPKHPAVICTLLSVIR